MILETLTLKNFGLYRGEQTLDLRPSRKNGQIQPIVLIGGINGGGKTTIFDAVQLALYGSRGNYSKRSNVPYDIFLRESIHHGIALSDGAAVELTFSITSGGEQHRYEVRRVWTQKRQTLRERLYVYRDGERDQSLAEHWIDLVEEVIPLGVSQLFFFDAEKIRFLADDDTGSESLGSAIKSLLGLDLAERLIADAAILETRLSEELPNQDDDAAVQELALAIEAKQEEIKKLREDRASLENQRLRAERKLSDARREFENSGGTHWEARLERERKLSALRAREGDIRQQLVRLAASPMPLTLVPHLLDSTSLQNSKEQHAREAKIVRDTLAKRDAKVIRKLEQEHVPKEVIGLIQRIQQDDRKTWSGKCGVQSRHSLSDSAQRSLANLLADAMPALLAEAKKLIAGLNSCIRDREQLQRILKQTPDDGDVVEIVHRLNETTRDAATRNEQANRLDSEIATLVGQQTTLQNELQKLRRSAVDHQIHHEEAARMAELTIRTQDTMKKYLQRATADKIDRLSGFISKSFRFLLRKKTLVQRVEIDPQSFVITLFGEHGKAIPKQRLSEGEKQIFAISVLWGLAQASPRPLPAIVDTPMARLDSEHRRHLVERYFPNASHQVVILSTDTEVDRGFYDALESKLARAYHLNYDEKSKVTVAKEGYFWQTPETNGVCR